MVVELVDDGHVDDAFHLFCSVHISPVNLEDGSAMQKLVGVHEYQTSLAHGACSSFGSLPYAASQTVIP